jgi:hypothetical protein
MPGNSNRTDQSIISATICRNSAGDNVPAEGGDRRMVRTTAGFCQKRIGIAWIWELGVIKLWREYRANQKYGKFTEYSIA